MSPVVHQRLTQTLAWLSLGVLLGVFIRRIALLWAHTGDDFLRYMAGPQALVGLPSSLYAPPVISSMQGFLYPPPALLLFAPLLSVDRHIGYLILAALGMVLALVSILVWLRAMARSTPALMRRSRLAWTLLVALGLLARPVFENAWDGQINTLVLACCVAYIALVMAGRSGWAGAVLAVGFWVKLYPAILILHAIRYANRRRFLLGFGLAAAAVPFVSWLVVPPGLYLQYFGTALPALSRQLVIHISNQSAAAFITRFWVSQSESLYTYDTHAIALSVRLAVLIVAGLSAGVMLLAARRSGRDSLTVGASLIAMIAPVAPLGWGHTYVYALPLFYLVGVQALSDRAWWRGTLLGLGMMLMSLPTQHVFKSALGLPWALQNCLYSRDLIVVITVVGLAWHLRAQLDGRAPLPAAEPNGAEAWVEPFRARSFERVKETAT